MVDGNTRHWPMEFPCIAPEEGEHGKFFPSGCNGLSSWKAWRFAKAVKRLGKAIPMVRELHV